MFAKTPLLTALARWWGIKGSRWWGIVNVVACRFLFAILGMKFKGSYMVKRTNNNDMARQSPRGNRIAAKVQTLVAEILRDKYMDDAVLNKVSLVGADAHGGLSFVRLYFYTHGDPTAAQARLDEITRAVRFELAARLNQKYTPEIKFCYDDTIERAERIEALLKGL